MDDDYKGMIEAGWQKIQSGQMPEAEQIFQATSRLFPQVAPPHISLGHLYLSQKRWDEARQEFEIASQINPHNSYIFYGLALAYQEAGRASEYALILQIQGDTPRNVGPREIALGLFASRRGDMAAALQHYRRAQDWFPDSTLLVEEVGATLIGLNRTTEARDVLDRAIHRQGGTVRIYSLLGDAEQRLGNHRAALNAFQAAFAEDQDSLSLLMPLTKLEFRLGHWRPAWHHLGQIYKRSWIILREPTHRPEVDSPAFRTLSPMAKRLFIRKAVKSNCIELGIFALSAPLIGKLCHANPWLFFGAVVSGSYLSRLLMYLHGQLKRRRL